MFKLMKYEFRKNLVFYIIILGLIIGLSLYVALSIMAESEVNSVISILLYLMLGWAGVLLIMVIGTISYAKEINSRTSYMSFMAPVNTFEIVGSKYLSMIIVTVVATSLYILAIYLNILLVSFVRSEFKDVTEMIDGILGLFDTDMIEVWTGLFVMMFAIWMAIILTINYIYVAITLSSTILANRRGKAWLAIGLFIVIRILTAIVEFNLPQLNFGNSVGEMLLELWPLFTFQILVIVGSYIGNSFMLKKRVSL